jgi:hypothetical protein
MGFPRTADILDSLKIYVEAGFDQSYPVDLSGSGYTSNIQKALGVSKLNYM